MKSSEHSVDSAIVIILIVLLYFIMPLSNRVFFFSSPICVLLNCGDVFLTIHDSFLCLPAFVEFLEHVISCFFLHESFRLFLEYFHKKESCCNSFHDLLLLSGVIGKDKPESVLLNFIST